MTVASPGSRTFPSDIVPEWFRGAVSQPLAPYASEVEQTMSAQGRHGIRQDGNTNLQRLGLQAAY